MNLLWVGGLTLLTMINVASIMGSINSNELIWLTAAASLASLIALAVAIRSVAGQSGRVELSVGILLTVASFITEYEALAIALHNQPLN